MTFCGFKTIPMFACICIDLRGLAMCGHSQRFLGHEWVTNRDSLVAIPFTSDTDMIVDKRSQLYLLGRITTE